MTIKILFTIMLLANYLFSAYQKVYIGEIDRYYKNKISYDELRFMIDDIEKTFESQLGMNIFDYSSDGKPIDILYLAPSKLEKRLLKKKVSLKRKLKKIKDLEDYFYENKEKIDTLKDELRYKNITFNNKVENLNEYIKDKNTKKLSSQQYKKVQEYVKTKKQEINKELKLLKKDQRRLDRMVSKFNNKVISYNNKVSQYNSQTNKLESMSRSFKKIKGKTFELNEVRLKTYYKNGKKIEERNIRKSMTKIEIYGFNNLAELKVIIAHEIAHLVGIPHI